MLQSCCIQLTFDKMGLEKCESMLSFKKLYSTMKQILIKKLHKSIEKSDNFTIYE